MVGHVWEAHCIGVSGSFAYTMDDDLTQRAQIKVKRVCDKQKDHQGEFPLSREADPVTAFSFFGTASVINTLDSFTIAPLITKGENHLATLTNPDSGRPHLYDMRSTQVVMNLPVGSAIALFAITS